MDLMSSVIRYLVVSGDKYNTLFQEAQVKNIALDIERENFLDLNST